jgi:hypothetical protein
MNFDLARSSLVAIVAFALGVAGVDEAHASGKIYWREALTDKILRADLDGSNVEDLVTTGLSVPRGIALDLTPVPQVPGPGLPLALVLLIAGIATARRQA